MRSNNCGSILLEHILTQKAGSKKLICACSLVHRSVNEVICHGIPDKRPLCDGDILNSEQSVSLLDSCDEQ